jgi:hypothetical protein
MLGKVDIVNELLKFKSKTRREEDNLLEEVERILQEHAFDQKNVLDNLKSYQKAFELIEEEDVDPNLIFKVSEIRAIALKHRLRFLDSQCYKYDFPYEAILKIDYLNNEHRKALKGFKLLSTSNFFKDKSNCDCALLFAPTNLGNYYLIHKWGTELKWQRQLLTWPLKNIENLFITLIVATAIIAITLPTELITLDRKAEYWCAYRIGIFFHLLIFNMGVTAYITFSFSKNLSTGIWNESKDF